MQKKAHGIDISKWQGSIDWDALGAAYAAGDVDFVIMRAGYGYSTTDPKFEEYYKEATNRGIPCGAYWYAYWGSGTPKQEAQAFLSVVSGKTFQYGIWYDVEYESSITSLDKTTRTNKVIEALSVLSESGRYVGLYASTDMINNRLDYSKLSAYDVWVAQYASVCTCKMPYGIWQYTSGGSVSGILGRVDRDYSYKYYPSIVVGKLSTGEYETVPDTPTTGEDNPPRETSTIETSPMTRGDLKSVFEKADELGLYITGSLTIGPMTDGDLNTMSSLLESLGLSFSKN